eukprot:3772404-Alexandrium_andersonii.AAC.1
MSASLVGSEMCIRDSNNIMSFKGLFYLVAALMRLKRGSVAWFGVPCSSCLLYTSDAADDM